MNASELAGLMSSNNWQAVTEAQKAGPQFIDLVRPYLSDPDEVQRLLAVDCVAASGGDEAPAILVDALADPNEQVRIHAVNALHTYPPEAADLLKAYDATRDPYVKQQLAMIAGEGEDVPVLELRSRLAVAEREAATTDVSDGLVAALAKRGEAQERTRFAQMLEQARGERVKELIDYCRYIDQSWLVPALRPVLDRDEMAVNLSSHRSTLILRGKDLAVDKIARLTSHEFSFTPDGATNYTEPQIREVIEFVEGFSA